MSVHLPILTNSEMRTFRRCPREHQIAYRMNVRSIAKADPLRFGTLMHDGLEAWWRSRMAGDDPDTSLSIALAAVTQSRDSDPYDIAKACALLNGYHARWIDQALEVLAVEVEFTAPLLNPATGAPSKTYQLGGKLDAVVRAPDGTVILVEHKSTSEDCEMGSPYWVRLRLDSQISTYMVGARVLGFDVQNALYDVVRKPGLKPLKASAEIKLKKDGTPYAGQRAADETPEEYEARVIADIAERPERYFVRGTVVRLADEEKDAAADAWMIARSIRDAELSQRHPRNVDSCMRWNRECEYLPACSGMASLDDPLRYRRAEQKHEELTPRTAA